jgi:arylsulfatase A-like enzyme
LVAAAPAAHASARPNIVYILADDMGYGDVSVLNPGRGKIRTPNLDRLAGAGMIFTDAHSGSSVCTPTRYGLLTGRYAWRTRLQRGVLDGAAYRAGPAYGAGVSSSSWLHDSRHRQMASRIPFRTSARSSRTRG